MRRPSAKPRRFEADPKRPAMPGERRAQRRRRAVGIASLAALSLSLLPLVVEPPLRLLWNASPSVPVGLYGVAAGRPRAGELAVARPPARIARLIVLRRYLGPRVPLIKPVAATAGATVCRYGLAVEIDGRLAALARAEDRLGRPLPDWSGCVRLREGQLFLLAPAVLDSFDGRYFGVVDDADVIGRATPLWIKT